MIIIEYLTQPGDNKEKIVKKVHHTQFNIDALVLEPGQLLHLPQRTEEGFVLKEYYTKPGDSLKTISLAFELKREDIEYFNTLTHLYVCRGQTISLLPVEEKVDEPLFNDHQFDVI